MFLKKLRVVYNDLTNSEKKISKYICEHPHELKTTTSYQLANHLDIGQSTIIRFSQKLGYRSFRELTTDLAISYSNGKDTDEIVIDESTDTTNRKIMTQYQDIASLTYSSNPAWLIDDTVNAIKSARQIVVYGVGNSNLFAEYLAAQLVNIGLIAHCGSNTHIIYSVVSRFTSDDLVILISDSGETKEVIKTAMIAKNNNTPIIAMTKGSKNKLHSLANITLKTVDFLTNSRLSATTIRCSQLCLIDMIYLNLFKSNFDLYYNLFSESEKLLDYKYLGNKEKVKK